MVALLWLAPQAAHAHGAIEGIGDFYAGLLHPLLVPAELLALVATGLLIGRSGLAACRRGIPTLAVTMAAGLALAPVIAAAPDMTTPLVAVALVAAAIVTTGLRAPGWIATGLAMLAGLAIGIDAAPEAGVRFMAFVNGAATLLTGTALVTIIAALGLRAEQHWQRIATQVAGSWITASAVLYLAFQLVLSTR
ncbi:HupE/UreJ family protein [Chelatococcus asaccharovorans]|nr:HupE/UreJ family protein [Chelatococcus asaccharovorans]